MSFLRAASRNSKCVRKITRHPWKAFLYRRKWTGSICGMTYRVGRYPEGAICPGAFHPTSTGEGKVQFTPLQPPPQKIPISQIDNGRKGSFTGVDQTGYVTLEPAH